MNIKKFGLLIFLAGFVPLTGCHASDQVKLDIYQYLNTDVKPVVAIHNEAVSDYNSYMTAEETDAKALLDDLSNEILPAMEDALSLLDALHYESEEVCDFAGQYKDVISMEKEALEMVSEAVADSDQDMLAKANEAIEDALLAMDTYQSDVYAFAASHGITLVEQEATQAEE